MVLEELFSSTQIKFISMTPEQKRLTKNAAHRTWTANRTPKLKRRRYEYEKKYFSIPENRERRNSNARKSRKLLIANMTVEQKQELAIRRKKYQSTRNSFELFKKMSPKEQNAFLKEKVNKVQTAKNKTSRTMRLNFINKCIQSESCKVKKYLLVRIKNMCDPENNWEPVRTNRDDSERQVARQMRDEIYCYNK